MFKCIKIEADWFSEKRDNILMERASIPSSVGLLSKPKANVGKARSYGVDGSIDVNKAFANGWWVQGRANFTFARSEYLEYEEPQYAEKYKLHIGQSLNQEYGLIAERLFIDEADVANSPVQTFGDYGPGDIKYVDQNGDGVVNDQDMVVIGRCEPIHQGGFNNNFIYKNLSLNVFFQWRYGSDVMNANRIIFEGNYANKSINQYKSYVDRWTPDNTDSKNFRVGGRGPSGVYSSRTIEDGSFLRLKTVQLAYTFPKHWTKKIRLSTVQVFIAGENLWTWTRYSGLDPEVSTKNTALTPNFDYSAYARNRIFTGGVKIVF